MQRIRCIQPCISEEVGPSLKVFTGCITTVGRHYVLQAWMIALGAEPGAQPRELGDDHSALSPHFQEKLKEILNDSRDLSSASQWAEDSDRCAVVMKGGWKH